MTIYNISVITSTGYPYYNKKIKNLPEGIKLFQQFFDFTEFIDRSHEPLDLESSFELNAGLISALFEFAKNIEKKILNLEFKSLNLGQYKGNPQKNKKYKGDALITAQTEVYLLHKSLKQKINLIYDEIISPKIPLESAYIITKDEDQKIIDILSDTAARNHVLESQSEIKNLANSFFNAMGKYGLHNIVITSFDLSPIIVLGEKYSYKDIEVILRNMGGIPNIDPMEWKHRQSFFMEKQVWVYLINSGVGVTLNGLFEPYFYLLIADPQSYLGEFPGKLATKFNFLLG